MPRYDLVIINRSFWPIYPVIGESLLRLAESISNSKKVGVIFQDHSNFRDKLKKFKRGSNVNFFPAWAGSSSSSNLFIRVLDSVFFMIWVVLCLIITRPKHIYISTDPPVIVPFVVTFFSKIFKSKLIYHIQDIHPEASNILYKMNSALFKFIKSIDAYSMKNAKILITLTNEMKDQIVKRSGTLSKILIIPNPSIPFSDNQFKKNKLKGFSFTGNLGRLQRVPLVLEAIKKYFEKGGNLNFFFAGGGIYSNSVKQLANLYPKVNYKGIISAEDAAELSSKYEWALLPIEDEITNFAFPSKSSSYVFSGSKILAICGKDTNVAKWISDNKLGLTVQPNILDLVKVFLKIEKDQLDTSFINQDRETLKKKLSIDIFVESLKKSIFSSFNNE